MSQTYKNHLRFSPPYHFVLVPVLAAGFIGSVINLRESWNNNNLYSASLLVLLFACLIGTALLARIFALRAQDRAVRAEENLRYFTLTGKLLPATLRLSQIIALRFAPDEELTDLAQRAATQNLSSKEIKKAIKIWRADHHRV